MPLSWRGAVVTSSTQSMKIRLFSSQLCMCHIIFKSAVIRDTLQGSGEKTLQGRNFQVILLVFKLNAELVSTAELLFRSDAIILKVAGVTFSDSKTESAPVPKFLYVDPGPEIFQIWESGSCSDSGYHRSNRHLPMFLHEKRSHRLLLLPELKSGSGSGFILSQIFDSWSERKTQNPAGVDSGSVATSEKYHSDTSLRNLPNNIGWKPTQPAETT